MRTIQQKSHAFDRNNRRVSISKSILEQARKAFQNDNVQEIERLIQRHGLSPKSRIFYVDEQSSESGLTAYIGLRSKQFSGPSFGLGGRAATLASYARNTQSKRIMAFLKDFTSRASSRQQLASTASTDAPAAAAAAGESNSNTHPVATNVIRGKGSKKFTFNLRETPRRPLRKKPIKKDSAGGTVDMLAGMRVNVVYKDEEDQDVYPGVSTHLVGKRLYILHDDGDMETAELGKDEVEFLHPMKMAGFSKWVKKHKGGSMDPYVKKMMLALHENSAVTPDMPLARAITITNITPFQPDLSDDADDSDESEEDDDESEDEESEDEEESSSKEEDDDDDSDSDSDSDSSDDVVLVKLDHQGEIRAIEVKADVSAEEFMTTVHQGYGMQMQCFYTDAEGDKIVIKTDEDLRLAFKDHNRQQRARGTHGSLRIRVEQKLSSSSIRQNALRLSSSQYMFSKSILPTPSPRSQQFRKAVNNSDSKMSLNLRTGNMYQDKGVREGSVFRGHAGSITTRASAGRRPDRPDFLPRPRSGAKTTPRVKSRLPPSEMEATPPATASSETALERTRTSLQRSALELELEDEDGWLHRSQSEQRRRERRNAMQVVDHFQKGELIGQGAFGKVFSALNLATGEPLALKRVKVSANPQSQRELKALEREIDLLKDLRHPNIVQYYGTRRQGNKLYIILELCPSGSIASAIQKFGHFSEAVIRRYCGQILRGLHYLHSQGIIHRDIKGHNILLKHGACKLADFGCSVRSCVEGNEEGSIGQKTCAGTTQWMAPEVMKEDGYGRKADIWSFAMTVVEMATGSPAWTNPAHAIFKICMTNDIPDIPEGMSEAAHSFMRSCFSRDPKLRPDAKTLFTHDFLKPPNANEANFFKTIASNRTSPENKKKQKPKTFDPFDSSVSFSASALGTLNEEEKPSSSDEELYHAKSSSTKKKSHKSHKSHRSHKSQKSHKSHKSHRSHKSHHSHKSYRSHKSRGSNKSHKSKSKLDSTTSAAAAASNGTTTTSAATPNTAAATTTATTTTTTAATTTNSTTTTTTSTTSSPPVSHKEIRVSPACIVAPIDSDYDSSASASAFDDDDDDDGDWGDTREEIVVGDSPEHSNDLASAVSSDDDALDLSADLPLDHMELTQQQEAARRKSEVSEEEEIEEDGALTRVAAKELEASDDNLYI